MIAAAEAMQTIALVQGTPEWHAHRLEHFNASDAPAMMGCSPYKTRTQLLDELVSGLPADVNEATQRMFDDGHRFEALARPLAEKIIGSELYPVVGTRGRLSASFDGLTMLEDVAFEHKTLNESLRAAIRQQGGNANDFLPLAYQVQCEHQCIVSPTCTRVLFMASRWADDGTLIEERHCWYTPNPDLAAQIIAGWEQFERDLHTHVVQPKAVQAVAEVVESLPAVSVRMDGAIAVVSNLDLFGAKLKAFIEAIDKNPNTDQAFANCEAAVKTLQRAEDALDQAESQALAQIDPVEAMRRTVADYRELARTTRLMLDKVVKARKESIRGEIVAGATTALMKHVAALNAEIAPMALRPVSADFGGAINGKRTVASLQDAVDTTLANAKIAANAQAQAIRSNLAVFKDRAAGHEALFADLHVIVHKAADDFALIVSSRIAEHQAREAKRLEAERERIRAEEQAKAQREAEAKQAQEIAEGRASQQVLKAEPATADATDRVVPVNVSPRGGAMGAGQAAAAAPVGASRQAPDEPATLKLGDICSRLGFTVSASFMHDVLQIHAAETPGRAVLFRESQWPLICRALIRHLDEISQAVEA